MGLPVNSRSITPISLFGLIGLETNSWAPVLISESTSAALLPAHFSSARIITSRFLYSSCELRRRGRSGAKSALNTAAYGLCAVTSSRPLLGSWAVKQSILCSLHTAVILSRAALSLSITIRDLPGKFLFLRKKFFFLNNKKLKIIVSGFLKGRIAVTGVKTSSNLGIFLELYERIRLVPDFDATFHRWQATATA